MEISYSLRNERSIDNYQWKQNTFKIYDSIISDKYPKVLKHHEDEKSVAGIRFSNTIFKTFPQKLFRDFPNLTQLEISGCLLDRIDRADLYELGKLVTLHINFCQLTSLPDDLLFGMPDLRNVSFFNNKIVLSSSKLLKPLLGKENVKVDLRGNKNIDAYFPGEIKSLEVLMMVIDENCRRPTLPTMQRGQLDFISKVKEMWVSGKLSDLTITAGDKAFKVHKTILGLQSRVFTQIFQDQSEATEIKIPDFSSQSVEALLKFIYTNEVSEGNAKEYFDIAVKFEVDAMKSLYEKIICDQVGRPNLGSDWPLANSNPWPDFLFAHQVSSQLLKEKAFRLIVKKIPENVPDHFMEDPGKLKKLIDGRQAYEEMLKSK